jgi:hypothetical protein
MNPKLTVNKLDGHSSNLLTFYLGLVRKYAVLDPMIFSENVCTENGVGAAATGFKIIRDSLYYSVIQDLSNMVFDSGKSNPSVANLTSKLQHDSVASLLRQHYSAEYCPNEEFSEIYREREIVRGLEFDLYLEQLIELSTAIQSSPDFAAAKSVRDEFTAHLDLKYVNGSYEYPDITKYGLKWNSPKSMIEELKPIMERLGFVIRSADFAWDSFDEQNTRISSGYWE